MKIRRHSVGPLTVEVKEKVSSTNDLVKERMRRSFLRDRGTAAPLYLIATSQERGRGRFERSFFSPPETGVYCTLGFWHRERVPAVYFTMLASVAIRDNLARQFGLDLKIKFVNDLLLGHRKVCGILTEMLSFDPAHHAVVLGFGLNLYDPPGGWPETISSSAGSLFGRPGAFSFDVNRLLADIHNRIRVLTDEVAREEPIFLEAYARHLLTAEDTLYPHDEPVLRKRYQAGILTITTPVAVYRIGRGEFHKTDLTEHTEQ